MRKILLVDDCREIRSIYKMLLELEGYEVIEAEEWESAADLLLEHKDLDLVLLDIRMPGFTGDVVFDAIRLYNPKLRVVVSSIYPLEEQKRMILKADDYFDKSSGVDLLMRKVRHVLSEPARSV